MPVGTRTRSTEANYSPLVHPAHHALCDTRYGPSLLVLGSLSLYMLRSCLQVCGSRLRVSACQHHNPPHRGHGRARAVLSRSERGSEGSAMAPRAGDLRSSQVLCREGHANVARFGPQCYQVYTLFALCLFTFVHADMV